MQIWTLALLPSWAAFGRASQLLSLSISSLGCGYQPSYGIARRIEGDIIIALAKCLVQFHNYAGCETGDPPDFYESGVEAAPS